MEYSSAESDDQDDINSDEEIKVHNDDEIEKKLSKIQNQLLKSSVFGSKAQDSKIVKIEQEMMVKVEAIEEKRDREVKEIMEREAKKSLFAKLIRYNTPKINIFIGMLVSIIQGSFMPLVGAIMAKMLFVLMEVTNLDLLREDANEWCFYMLLISVSAIFTGLCQKLSFGVIGENVAFNIRRTLYRKILEKH